MKQLATLIGGLLLATQLWAASPEISVDSNDVILNGYDAVAYFTENEAIKGSSKYTASYNGAIYQFSSKKHRNLFQTAPAKYAPVYGGYCAFGTALGKKFAVNGKAFEIVDGKLYVNKNLSVYKTWKKDIPSNIQKADNNWQTIETVPANKL